MIFLIDDKKKRQEDFGWTEDKFNQYKDIIQPIYSLNDLKSSSSDIFQNGNVVLYHESFIDNTIINDKAVIKRKKLEDYVNENSNFHLAIFSGSKSTRSLENRLAHLPVSLVFQHLDVLSHKVLDGDINLKYLLFGEHPEIEGKLFLKLDAANKEIDSLPAKIPYSKNLFVRTVKGNIQNPIKDAVIKTLFSDVSDEKLSKYVNEWLIEDKFDSIFIPLCFGPTLSDYNGLRLATHIRCSNTLNQLTNIFIYSFVNIEYLINNEFFNILKTKNVQLVDYKKSAFQEAVGYKKESFTNRELSHEISKLKIEIPKNYEDSHSIANEWAIYRWASVINANDNHIEKVISNVETQLYFKYLKTLYPINDIPELNESQLIIPFSKSHKILYIDDEADRGWAEILYAILLDRNNIDFNYLGEELKKRTRDEIIKLSINKIKTEDTDLVILDFRLHPDDFQTTNIQEVTGLKLLKAIKNLNPGIQVIIFSATNKVWNLQALQETGADGFIVKESPENSINSKFTTNVITSFATSMNVALKKKFLKHFFENCRIIKHKLIECDRVVNTDFDDFINELLNHLKLIELAGKEIRLEKPTTIDIVFLNCFSFLEKVKKHYLVYDKADFRYYLGEEQYDFFEYSIDCNYKKKKISRIKKEGVYKKLDKPSMFNAIVSIASDYFGSFNATDAICKDLQILIWNRNDFIHEDKKHFSEKELELLLTVIEKLISRIKE